MSSSTALAGSAVQNMIRNVTTGKLGAGRLVPPRQAHLKRFLFVFVVDISGSTGAGGANADIHAINRDLGAMFDHLRNAPATSPLGLVKNQIDVALLTYCSDVDDVFDWKEAGELPTSFNFTPRSTTGTGKALNAAVDKVSARLRQLKQPGQKIATGLPHIFHLTDGEPTDLGIGSTQWTALKARLEGFTGGADPEKVRPKFVHFITPNGCAVQSHSTLTDETGQKISGQQLLSKLSGPASVVELAQGGGSLPAMVNLVTMVITRVTSIAGATADEAIQAGIIASQGALKAAPGTLPPTNI